MSDNERRWVASAEGFQYISRPNQERRVQAVISRG
jgi:hypothetical protein